MSLQNLLNNPHEFKAFDKEYREDESPICVVCGHGERIHKCEVCENRSPKVMFLTMLMCQECYQEQKAAQEENESGAEQRVIESREEFKRKQAIDVQKILQETIEYKSDYFNANIPSILELRDSINPTLDAQTKHEEYTKLLIEQVGHLKHVLLEMDDVRMKVSTRLKNMQTEINSSANELRAEVRAKLQIENINYHPVAPKVAKTPKAPKVGGTTVRVNTKEIDAAAAKYGVPAQTITMLVKFRGLTIDQACKEFLQVQANVVSKD